MKYLLSLILLCLSSVVCGQITPLPEDIPFLETPYNITEIYIGHKNCEMVYIVKGKKEFQDVLYYTKSNNSSTPIKIPLPETLAKKKRVVFIFKTETGIAFASKKSSEQRYTFYLGTMTWLSETKKRGHDGEDEL